MYYLYVQQGQSTFTSASESHKYWNCVVGITDKFSVLFIEDTCFNEVHQSLLCRQHTHLKIFSSWLVKSNILIWYLLLYHLYSFQHWITDQKSTYFHPSHNLHLCFEIRFSFWKTAYNISTAFEWPNRSCSEAEKWNIVLDVVNALHFWEMSIYEQLI